MRQAGPIAVDPGVASDDLVDVLGPEPNLPSFARIERNTSTSRTV